MCWLDARPRVGVGVGARAVVAIDAPRANPGELSRNACQLRSLSCGWEIVFAKPNSCRVGEDVEVVKV